MRYEALDYEWRLTARS